MQDPELPKLDNNEEIRKYLLNYKKKQTFKGIIVPIKRTNTYCKFIRQINKGIDVINLPRIFQGETEQEKLILVDKQLQIEQLNGIKKPDENIKIAEKQITLTQQNYTTEQLFQLFPKTPNYPNSFETVGHLAHFNLTEEQIPFEQVVGQITLLKAKNIKTVVNKTQKLHNVYRTPTLILMAGDHNYQVSVKQGNVNYQFNFQKVYWCSRLQHQRDRLLKNMKKGELLLDIFCGVGPLALRAAKKGLFVFANDLNPDCYKSLTHNSKQNKLESRVKCFNLCAREAMRVYYKDHLTYDKEFQTPNHIYMNLPVDAIQFLDVLVDFSKHVKIEKMPFVHVNCFVVADSDEKSKQLLTKRIAQALPGFKAEQILDLHLIKNVTIIMRMYCVTFQLREEYIREKVQQAKIWPQNVAESKQQIEPKGQPSKKVKQNTQ